VRALGFDPKFRIEKKAARWANNKLLKWIEAKELKILCSPKQNEVLKTLARRYLDLMGARRLIALDYRTQRKGQWSERTYDRNLTVNLARPDQPPEVVKLPSYYELEKKYFVYSQIAKGRGNQEFAEQSIKKLEELDNLIPPSIAHYDESQLAEYAEKLIESI
jgi:hypothetical protein